MTIGLLFFKGSFARTLETLTGIALGFFMLPFLVRHLGEDLYGLWVLVSSLTATLYLFDLGFASAVTRFVARYISRQDDDQVNRIVSSSLVIYTGLALAILAACTGLALLVPYWLPNHDRQDLIQTLVLITGATLAVEFPFKSFAGIAASYMRYDLLSYSRIFFKIATTLAILILVLQGHSLLAMAIVGLLGSSGSNLLFLLIARRLHRPLQISLRLASRTTMRELFQYSAWAFLIDLTHLAKSKADILIVGSLLSTSVLTLYYVAVRLSDYALEFLAKALNLTTPVFARLQARNDYAELGAKVMLFCRLNMCMAGLGATLLISFGEPIITFWMTPQFQMEPAYQALVLLVIAKMAMLAFAPLSHCLYAISRHRHQAWIELLEALCAIPLAFVLIRYGQWGILGAAAGISSPYLLTRGLFLPWLTTREIGLSLRAFYRSVLPMLGLGILAVLSSVSLTKAYRIASLLELMLLMAVVTTAYLALGYALLTSAEKAKARALLSGFLRIPARTPAP